MKVSVITVCFNAIRGIEKTIQSVLSQSYPEIEYIVIDGGSNDGTVDVIRKYSESLFYFVSEPDNGIYDAMNKGVKVATGEWINFMNAGDCFFNNRSVEQVFENEILSSVDVVYGFQVHVFSFGRYVRKRLSLSNFHAGMPFGHEASFVRSEIMKSHDFCTSFKILADYNFFYQLYVKGGSFHFVNVIVTIYDNIEGASSSDKNALLILDEFAKIKGTYNTSSYKKARNIKRIKLIIKKSLSFFSKRLVSRWQHRKIIHQEEFIPLDTFLLTYTAT